VIYKQGSDVCLAYDGHIDFSVVSNLTDALTRRSTADKNAVKASRSYPALNYQHPQPGMAKAILVRMVMLRIRSLARVFRD
jgi:nucleoside-specific outer membrane channel protein Tsx